MRCGCVGIGSTRHIHAIEYFKFKNTIKWDIMRTTHIFVGFEGRTVTRELLSESL